MRNLDLFYHPTVKFLNYDLSAVLLGETVVGMQIL
jgi:hypothetical protein